MNFLGCELVHLNPNTIAALSCFAMLSACWLGIVPDTSLFLYFYSLTRYDKTIYSGIGLSPHRSHWKDYIDATFKSTWRGSFQRWFLVDMHVTPLKDQRRRPEGEREWEPIKIPRRNLAYIPNQTRQPSLLTRPGLHSH
jgi:hypothetical protein